MGIWRRAPATGSAPFSVDSLWGPPRWALRARRPSPGLLAALDGLHPRWVRGNGRNRFGVLPLPERAGPPEGRIGADSGAGQAEWQCWVLAVQQVQARRVESS
jgi:hypothetical protein